jgi:hypothetical protein
MVSIELAMYEASAEARNATTAAASSAPAKRCRDVRLGSVDQLEPETEIRRVVTDQLRFLLRGSDGAATPPGSCGAG